MRKLKKPLSILLSLMIACGVVTMVPFGAGAAENSTDRLDISLEEVPGHTFLLPDSKALSSIGSDDELVGYSVSLGSSIVVNFYYRLTEALLTSDTAYVQFTIPTCNGVGCHDVYVRDVRDNTIEINNETCCVFSCSVTPGDINSVIHAQLIDGENRGGVYSYSVREYAEYLTSNAYTDDTHKVVKVQEYADAYDMAQTIIAYSDTL